MLPRPSPRSLGPLVALLLFTASPAYADEASTIIERCTHGQSLAGFSQQAYLKALKELPTGVSEYSDCSNLIRQAELAASVGGLGIPGVAIPLTPTERRALNHVRATGSAPIQVGGQAVRPGVVPVDIASVVSSLPTSLQAVLALMLAYVLLRTATQLRNRVRARRRS
jgi:hypothetical protein